MKGSVMNQSQVPYLVWNLTTPTNGTQFVKGTSLRWGVLGLLAIILFSALGNLLVCMAVCWERRLQNMTNYFLMSLAIADFLVSLLVMPLGMIVELYGLFPLDPELCVLWVTSDVLMCTASIWHMCTMSMDRYFTLKYPMRYGRNKTKTMVLLKIFFVWVVSIAISSPICIHGFVDMSVVYQDGLCVPTLKNFVVYGSIFAFYIPLLIMIATYVLTIRILMKNERLMKHIERSDMRPRLGHLNQDYNVAVPRLLTTPSNEAAAARRVSFTENQELNTSYLMPPKRPQPSPVRSSTSKSPELSETDEEDLDPKSSTQLLEKRSQSYKSLCSHHEDQQMLRSRSKESVYNLSFEASDEEGPLDFRKPVANLLQVPTDGLHRFGRGHLHGAVSDTKLDTCNRYAARQRVSLHRSVTELDTSTDYKSREWDKRFYQIQQEMDQCLRDSEKEKARRQSEKPELVFCDDFVRYSLRPLCHSAPNTPLRSGFTSDSGDSLDKDTKSTSSNSSDIITIHLKSPRKSKLSSPSKHSLKALSQRKSSLEPTSPNGRLPHDLLSNLPPEHLSPEDDQVMSESADNTADELDSDDHQTMRLTRRNRFKKSFRNTIRRTRPVIKHLLSKKAATNERKASKVLGIIFIVFVFLWTPFFIVNILSVTCEACMASVTPTMMSVFLWMGYAASLANPIIYTMFNTAFRRTFIKILTCKIQRRRSKFAETAFMSYTTMMNTDRRNTMTVLIKDESR